MFQFSEAVTEIQIKWVEEEGESESSPIVEEEYLNEHTQYPDGEIFDLIHIVKSDGDLQRLYFEIFSPPPERF